VISGNRALNIENLAAKRESELATKHDLKNETKTVSQNLLLSAYAFLEIISILASGLLIAHLYVSGFLGQTDYYQSYITPLSLAPILTIAFFRGESLIKPLRCAQIYK